MTHRTPHKRHDINHTKYTEMKHYVTMNWEIWYFCKICLGSNTVSRNF